MLNTSQKERFNRAIQLEKSGDYSTALNEYFSIIRENSSFREAYINLGVIYSRINRLTEAMKCYEKALSMGEDFQTYFNMGCIYYKVSKYKKAIINLEKSRNLNSSFTLASLVMGLCFSRLNNIKAAETNFKNVLKIWPQNRVALTALAIIYYNQDKYNDSIKLLNRLLKLDEKNTKIRELKSDILYKTGRIDESAEEIKSLRTISDGYKYFDEFIKSVPVEVYTDKYGTIDDKIELLKSMADSGKNCLISLSLCHLFKGETDIAIDYLFSAKKILLT